MEVQRNVSTVFGNWKTTRPLGTGTHGNVYEIVDEHGRKCAYKVMRIPVSTEDEPDTFPKKTQEIRLKEVGKDIKSSIAFLQRYDRGRSFVSYEEFSLAASEDFKTLTLKLRMERLMSLTEIMNSTTLTEDEILRLAINICICLEKCRKIDYIYPNLKPENIFVTPERCKLGDLGNFGFYEPRNTNIAMRKSQDYMAPELYERGDINVTCDTYSLGLVIYALLNRNRLPFIPGTTASVTVADSTRAIEKRCRNYVLPDPVAGSVAIRKIIAKACAFKPEMRYQSPSEMKQDLGYVLSKQEELLGTYTEPEERVPVEEIIEEETTTEKPVASPALDTVKTYTYASKSGIKISLDKKKKILLIAIAVVFLALVGLVIAAFIQETSPEMIIMNIPEVISQTYESGQVIPFIIS